MWMKEKHSCQVQRRPHGPVLARFSSLWITGCLWITTILWITVECVRRPFRWPMPRPTPTGGSPRSERATSTRSRLLHDGQQRGELGATNRETSQLSGLAVTHLDRCVFMMEGPSLNAVAAAVAASAGLAPFPWSHARTPFVVSPGMVSDSRVGNYPAGQRIRDLGVECALIPGRLNCAPQTDRPLVITRATGLLPTGIYPIWRHEWRLNRNNDALWITTDLWITGGESPRSTVRDAQGREAIRREGAKAASSRSATRQTRFCDRDPTRPPHSESAARARRYCFSASLSVRVAASR